MVLSLAKYKNKLKEDQESKKSQYTQDYSIFPHWNLDFGKHAQVRLLPNGDTEAQVPWTVRKQIPTSFPDPEDDSSRVYFNVPCLEQYDPLAKCPALAPVRDLYRRAKELEKRGDSSHIAVKKTASAHWLDTNYYWNALILKPGFVEEGLPADLSPIRTLNFTKQIQSKIESDLGIYASEDAPPPVLNEWPQGEFTMEDVEAFFSGEATEETLQRFLGRVFYISKIKKAGTEHAEWTGSKFDVTSYHELTEDDLQAIKKYGLPDLSKKLPPRPTPEQYEVLAEIVYTSINNGEWNPEWETHGFKFYRRKSSGDGEQQTNPIKTKTSNTQSLSDLKNALNKHKSVVKQSEVVETSEEVAPAEEAPVKKDAKSLAAEVRARMNKAKE